MKNSLGAQRWIIALVSANMVMALGPLFVRLADCGAVSAAFWRVALPLPLFAILAWRHGERLSGHGWPALAGMLLAGIMFGIDLALWNLGITRTRLGNAALFGNCGSVILMLWAVVAERRRPRWTEAVATLAALAGAMIILGRSLEINARTLAGDLLSIGAGLAYVGYLLPLRHWRDRFGASALLVGAGLAALPVLVGTAWMMGEPFWPQVWWPVLALALCSQVIGQLLLVSALRHVSPLVVGISLLSQPGVGLLIGWFGFGETIGLLDGAGLVLVSGALVLARAGEPG